MAIKGLGFDMMSAYNRIDNRPVSGEQIKTQEIKPQEVKTAASDKKVQASPAEEDFSGIKINLNFDSIRRRPGADLGGASRDFTRRDGFNIAIDDQAMKTDMDRAVAAMEKDSSLKQYQYFVGDKSNIITNDEDGLVFIK